jgi:Flp pilus assembly protein TadG
MTDTSREVTKRQPRGQALVMMAVALIALMGFGALAIDVGMMFLAKNELQNAADAAALAASQQLYYGGCTDCPQSRWTITEDSARAGITYNKAMKSTLATGTVTTGWWNITGTPAGMQPKTKSPIVAGDAAAVRVVIQKSPGNNGGPVSLLMAAMFGGQRVQTITASAVAVVSFPSSVAPNTTFPTAINNCMYDVFWDKTLNKPKIDPATGNPYIFRIGSSYHYGTCDSGQWTTLLVDNNSAAYEKALVQSGNPTQLSIGQNIWIQPGTENSIYKEVPVPSVALLPVVQDVSSSTHAYTPIVGFGPFHIIASVGGSGKYLEGYFDGDYEVPIAVGGGPFFGAVVPPSLVQ